MAANKPVGWGQKLRPIKAPAPHVSSEGASTDASEAAIRKQEDGAPNTPRLAPLDTAEHAAATAAAASADGVGRIRHFATGEVIFWQGVQELFVQWWG